MEELLCGFGGKWGSVVVGDPLSDQILFQTNPPSDQILFQTNGLRVDWSEGGSPINGLNLHQEINEKMKFYTRNFVNLLGPAWSGRRHAVIFWRIWVKTNGQKMTRFWQMKEKQRVYLQKLAKKPFQSIFARQG